MRQARTVRRVVALAALVALLAGGGLGTAPQAEAGSRWASTQAATIRPGASLVTGNGQCTANFVFFQGEEVYLGQAAHCARTDQSLNWCAARSLPLGTPVRIEGATRPGTLVYSSILAMQAAGERDPATCFANDFALVRVDPVDRTRVNPTLPHWGGPTGIARTAPRSLTPVFSLGNSSLRQGLQLLQPKSGTVLGQVGGGWRHDVYLVLPGIPGDSGSAVLDAKGRALGVVSTIAYLPVTGSNGVVDMSKALRYARAHGFPNLLLALGTQPFRPGQLPLG